MNPLLLRRRCMAHNADVDYSKQYLTIMSLEDNNEIIWKTTSNGDLNISIEVSTNGSTWVNKDATQAGIALATLNAGDILYLRTREETVAGYSTSADLYDYFSSTGQFALEGNIMSLLYRDNFWNYTALPTGSYTFHRLFGDCDGLVDITNLVMPATTLRAHCYERMFAGSGITSLPGNLLPATTLADNCYERMFALTSFTDVPEGFLPATTLAQYCYQYMFVSSAVVSVPADLLPATTVVWSCYRAMFSSCESLAAAPDLPASRLTAYCYRSMFYHCYAIKSVKCLATTGLGTTECTQAWLTGAPSGGTFYAKSGVSWASGGNGIPSGWTRINV